MTAIELLNKIMDGEISIRQVKRAQDLRVIGRYEEGDIGWLGYETGEIETDTIENMWRMAEIAYAVQGERIMSSVAQGKGDGKTPPALVRIIMKICEENRKEYNLVSPDKSD